MRSRLNTGRSRMISRADTEVPNQKATTQERSKQNPLASSHPSQGTSAARSPVPEQENKEIKLIPEQNFQIPRDSVTHWLVAPKIQPTLLSHPGLRQFPAPRAASLRSCRTAESAEFLLPGFRGVIGDPASDRIAFFLNSSLDRSFELSYRS